MEKNGNISRIFLGVYTAISIATLYHSSYGFGTIDGLPDSLSGFSLFKWWFLGFLCATSVDVGMGAIVWSMMRGYKSRYLSVSLVILAIFSAYSQLIYSAYFAEDMEALTKKEELRPFMQTILDIRIIVLPLCLPFFSLFYGFVAKDSSKKILKDEKSESKPKEIVDKEEKGRGTEEKILSDKIIESEEKQREIIDNMRVVHHMGKNNKTSCGLIDVENTTKELRLVTCKNCSRVIKELLT
jgi:hypothetical protein